MVFIPLSVNAQKSGLAKPVGNKLQPPVENKMPVVSAATADNYKTLHNTASKQSSFSGPKPI